MDNQPAEMPTPSQLEPPKANKPRAHLNSLAKLLLLIVIIVLCIGGTYYWQHNKVNTLNSKVASLQSQLTSAKSANSSSKQTTTSSSSNSQGTLSSVMPQSQFSNPEFTATLEYLGCLGESGSTYNKTYTVCTNGNQSYSQPTTFTYAMITNYSWLPESADTTFINATRQQFQNCLSPSNQISGANRVDYSSADFVIFTYNICGDSKTGLYQDKNGSWTSIASSIAGGPLPSCSPYSSDNIPEIILKDNGICE